MDANGWTVIIGAIGLAVLGVVKEILAYFRSRDLARGVKVVEGKLDNNTRITTEGTHAAAVNAKVAAQAASKAEEAASAASKKLNGGLDDALNSAINPVRETLEKHIQQDRADLQEVKEKFDVLTEYVHKRNHDLLDTINAQTLKIEAILQTRGK